MCGRLSSGFGLPPALHASRQGGAPGTVPPSGDKRRVLPCYEEAAYKCAGSRELYGLRRCLPCTPPWPSAVTVRAARFPAILLGSFPGTDVRSDRARAAQLAQQVACSPLLVCPSVVTGQASHKQRALPADVARSCLGSPLVRGYHLQAGKLT